MYKKLAKSLVFTGLLWGMAWMPSSVHADSMETGVAVTFTADPEKQPPADDGGSGVLPVTKKASGFGVTPLSNKRLPSTGEEYQAVLAQLGYLAVLIALIAFLLTRRWEKADEEKQ
ncbi:LPXTG cell wall anchor domain-containing protein [Enterococcus sp. DIV0187]|uniref:LPXTG cell wall anchor domain-containing protein n=1 Tax=Enterococcus sp. DIV0187 TaxID=2774644 RepID=UPI003F227ACB